MNPNTTTITLDLTEWQKEQLVQDFEYLKDEHQAAAKNEHIWALGAKTDSDSIYHECNSELQRKMIVVLDSLIKELKR